MNGVGQRTRSTGWTISCGSRQRRENCVFGGFRWTISRLTPGSRAAPVVGKGFVDGCATCSRRQPVGRTLATREAGDQPFSSSDEAYTEALSAILSGAVSRAIHVDSLERLAFNDPLTGLANRRALDDAALTAFDQIRSRSGRRVSVVTLDLNGLKSVNDEHGHAEGDRLLTRVPVSCNSISLLFTASLVARVAATSSPSSCPATTCDASQMQLRRLPAGVPTLPIGSGLACGIATTTDGGSETAKRLLFAADQAQYAAKREQRTTPLPAAAPYSFDYSAAR